MADVYTRIGYIKGATGAQGAQGVKGDTGDAATIAVGTVTTVPYGQTANVVNSGTSGAAIFDFTIPQGRPGEQTTDMQNLTLGSITTSSASFPVPAVGETGKVLWGKVVKWFSDMSALVATKLNINSVVNNLTTTEEGFALDARQGKVLNDKLNDLFLIKSYTFAYSCNANSSTSITGSQFGVSTPTGYVPIGVISHFTGSQYVFAYRIMPQNTGAQTIMSLHNASGGTVNVSATINIVYARYFTVTNA